MLVVHDLEGNLVGYLEAEKLRDAIGKPIGERASNDSEERKLAMKAAAKMTPRKVLLDLGVGDVITPTTQFTASLPPPDGEFVADRVSPVRMVKKTAGTFFAQNATDALTLVDPSAAGIAQPALINPGFVSTSFTTAGFALGFKVPRTLAGNADFDLKKIGLARLIRALRLAREYRVWNLLTTANNWPAGNKITLGATAKWNTGNTANPLGDMMSALAASYQPANKLVISENVAQYFYVQPQANTGIRDYVQADGEMPDRLYARAKILSGGSPAYLWSPTNPTNVPLVRVPDDPDEIGTTQTVRWNGESPDGTVVAGMLARVVESPADDSQILILAHNDAEVFISNKVGALIVGALQ